MIYKRPQDTTRPTPSRAPSTLHGLMMYDVGRWRIDLGRALVSIITRPVDAAYEYDDVS